jgi:threonine dehydrogenase-like Zn-dependent dehydrogenase
MIQAIIKKGKVLNEEVPAPLVSKGSVLIKVVNSSISAGTELIGFATSKKSIIKRALDQPYNVKKVINMARSERIARVYQKVKNKIDSGQPSGYSLSGMVVGIGEGVNHFRIGDKVAAGGAGVANHAEYVDVPQNLVASMPQGLGFADASTVTLGAIAMQGVRRADLNLGEFAVVFGVGVIGLLSVQMLAISGIRVAIVDLDEERLQIGIKVGAELAINPAKDNSVQKITNWSNGFGVDAVLFTAATRSSDPLSQSFRMCRKKGKVILVGVSGMNIKRADIYKKELDLLMSTSYGPGRYDRKYEEKGLDYPYAYVRWTENRNMSEYLRLLSTKLINLDHFLIKKYPIEKAGDAFEVLNSSEDKPLTAILDYGEAEGTDFLKYKDHDRKVLINNLPIKKDIINIALIGAGNFAVDMHLPNIAKLSDKFRLYAVSNRTGYKGKFIAQQYNAQYVTTNYQDILEDDNVDLVMITTRHDSHAELTLRALSAGKHVFVEKPLAVNEKELEDLKAFFEDAVDPPVLMVGFNRRFSKYARIVKIHTDARLNPLFIHYRMNAGYVAA